MQSLVAAMQKIDPFVAGIVLIVSIGTLAKSAYPHALLWRQNIRAFRIVRREHVTGVGEKAFCAGADLSRGTGVFTECTLECVTSCRASQGERPTESYARFESLGGIPCSK